ncbi:leucine efflux protein LeuE [Moraxella catarrhalis]|uniref:Threonine efflux protein n=1 Tax=Moraxella catarrhalis TaxID=480 RepID=A0AB36DPF1_MORCA|nr:leucine efflux protein LeuE [Moraxella catarrhalis]MPX28529.1 leucine efflux protein LeuE [Moraxella catarrhalis]OAV14203.1 Threonine efflux protein [Moraxella catarrhalis]OAV25918.1 Threonine efflux protein [Moraxella catarrhalis]RKL87123.1 leucine efflux protein LeuE [Moraxella catarrhalis]RKL88451.1 leucine efflux protein LeuE [Moraxella catarrhalis]
MFGTINLLTYFLAVVVVIVLPGPNSLYCLSVSASHGHTAGLRAIAGVLLGDLILIMATVFGVGAMLKQYPQVFDVIKLIGGTYLAYIGTRLIIGAYHTFKNRQAIMKSELSIKPPKKQNYFYRSLSLSLTNPKAILFFLSFFVQFVDPNYDKPWLSFLVLAVILQMVSVSYLTLLVYTGKALAEKFSKRPVLSSLAMFSAAMLFIGFGVNLWISQI